MTMGRTQRAFTLLELLGVVVLMGLAAALAAGGLSGASDDSRRRTALAAVRDIDARARLLCASGEVELVVAEDRGALVLRRGVEFVVRTELPGRCTAHLLARDQPLESIMFTRAGTSRDYTVHLDLPPAPVALDIAGLTGWIELRETGGVGGAGP